jgi:acyl carrier protein
VEVAVVARIEKDQIAAIVLDAIRAANQLRSPEHQIEETTDAPLFGGRGELDSLGLVSLLMDIEELLLENGVEVLLSSEDAMSQSRSPYRDVPALVEYIASILDRTA